MPATTMPPRFGLGLAVRAVAAALALAGCHGSPEGGDAIDRVGGCGAGSWRPGVLEIHHIDVGQGDSTLIVSPTGRTLLIDAGETSHQVSRGAEAVGAYVKGVLGCARLDHVLVTHFHLDHVGYVGKGGLWHLVNQQGFIVGKTLHRDVRAYVGDSSGTITRWRDYLDGPGQAALHPEVVERGDRQVDLGAGVTFTIVTSDGDGVLQPGDFSADESPPNENDYSVAGLLRMGKLDYFIGGDLSGQFSAGDFGYSYHDIETAVARRLPDVDVYRVNHHGSDHSSNATLLAQLQPEVSIVSLGDGNSFGHPRQATMDRLLRAGAVYLTERGEPATNIGVAKVAGNVVLRTVDGVSYTVGGDPFVATDPARVDADGDGYFREADPDDGSSAATPARNGGCDPRYQACPAL